VLSLLVALIGVFAVTAIVTGARLLDAQQWRRSLVCFEVLLPNDIDINGVTNWFSSLAALTHALRGAVLPEPPVVLDIIGESVGIKYWLRMPENMQAAVLASLRAALPGVRLVSSTSPTPLAGQHLAAEVHMSGRLRQLAIERAELISRSVLAAMQPVGKDSRIHWQWTVTGAGTPEPLQTPDDNNDLPWWLESTAPSDADELRAARLKQRLPMLHVVGRLVTTAPTTQTAGNLFGRSWGGLRLLNVPGARLVRRWWVPSGLVRVRLYGLWLPLFRWPLRLNSAELAGLAAFPVGDSPLPGLPLGLTRQVPPPNDLPTHGTVLADATYPGMDRPLAMATKDRLMHLACLGPTGTGKSTLMINMALQDADRGDGLAVLDPKADMAADLISRLPRARWDDVIIVNPADTDRPIGFNVLANDGTEAGRELAVDHVLHVFHEQWRESWGPRTDAILRASLLALTSTRAMNGAAFTVCELPALLTRADFRKSVTRQSSIPVAVREFFDWFESLSSAERTQVVGPVLNKLTALTQRTPLRLMLGQSEGLNLAQAIRERKVLLMPLSRGLVGAETAGLLSSLMMASLWQAALGRVRTPQAARRPWWLYVDEAAEVVRLPLDLADVMAEARGLGVGLTLAMQHLSQLPTEVRHAMLATVRSQVVFQVEPADARVLEPSFAPTLSRDDLQNLPAHEIAMHLSINGRTSRPTTGVTRPLPEPIGDGAALRRASRERYGTERRDVEAELLARLAAPNAGPAEYGKRPRRDGGRR
jgi:hypothetical protein